MKNWISATLALVLFGCACASWIHAASTNLLADDEPTILSVPAASAPSTLSKVEARRSAIDEALGNIKVADQSPEEVRAAFTNYWNARLCLDLSELKPWEQKRIERSLKTAHLERIRDLSEELRSAPPTWELQFVAGELVRGAKATAE